jgi:hypothetical protein
VLPFPGGEGLGERSHEATVIALYIKTIR